jgi:septal ring factor EnvC (AmiA/AmiB activator)
MRIFVSILFVFFSVTALCQSTTQYSMSKEEMMAKRKEIMDAISETEKQLAAIKSDKQATMGQLRALQNKLAERQRLIRNINDEVNDIDNNIRRSSKEVTSLKSKLDHLKERYVQSLRYDYENRSSYDMLAFLFSAHDFNDAWRRMTYLKKFRDYRKQQVEQIRVMQGQLTTKIGTLNQEKNQKDKVLDVQMQQKQVLVKETEQTNQVVNDLKGKESQLLRDIEKNRATTARINKAINSMIEMEMAKAAKRAEEAAAKTKPVGATKPEEAAPTPGKPRPPRADAPTLMLTPNDIELAKNFEGNKGKLYWPVDKGYIIEHFGEHPHPLAPQVMIDNVGVDIQTDERATIRAVFDGTVSKVFSVSGSAQIVMIVHGNYFTVYSGLATVSVKSGQQVTAKQPIGTVATNSEDLPVINFQVWRSNGHSQIKLNPEQWIGRPR